MVQLPAPPSSLDQPVTTVWGVGQERAALLARLNILTVGDLLLHAPRRYEDRRKFLPIRELELKEPATVRGRIIAAGSRQFRRGARGFFECVLDDGTARLHCRWWQAQPWMADWYAVGREFLVYGKPGSLKPRTIDHPETEWFDPEDDAFIHVGRIVPIHPLTEGLTARVVRALMWRALDKFVADIPEPALGPDLNQFPVRSAAVRMIHFPDQLADAERARQRLAFDEFVAMQSQIAARRKNFEASATALPCAGDNQLIKPFLSRLGFTLTQSQTHVLRDVRADLGGRFPMRRLLQGDVGSGKTVVAACAVLMVLESGFNAILMVPTEILAEQHYLNFSRWFAPLNIPVHLQTGQRKTPEASRSSGSSRSLTIGTHALLSGGFTLPRLGLVIIDEQHKFGVTQREALLRKGDYPHLLVLTATPIPRTLGLTLYGDLDVSVIEHAPAGRGSLKTFLRPVGKLPLVFQFMRDQLTAGRQGYVVYPRIESVDPARQIKAVTSEFKAVSRALAPFKVALLHGQMSSAEKESVMQQFRLNQIHALVATSLIEVGVDVPNATLMVIENAEQFGLAQLHQLRGRIGRGTHDSFCILVSDARNQEAQSRLKVLEQTSDGFKIAEADLALRGPGELIGEQQSGLPPLRFGDFSRDLALIKAARDLVRSRPQA